MCIVFYFIPTAFIVLLKQIHQAALDRWAPNSEIRWLSTILLLLLFALRVFFTQVSIVFLVLELPRPAGQNCSLAKSSMALRHKTGYSLFDSYPPHSGI